MTKLLIGLLGAGVLATGGWAAASGLDADPARTVSLPAATSTGETTTDTTTTATTSGTTTSGTTTSADISGPCDEAEHRNDPRCTGGAATDDGGDYEDDRSGPNRDSDDDAGDDDRSGSN